MTTISRRGFLAAASTTALGALLQCGAATAHGIEPFVRRHPRFTGLGLTAYSLRPLMRWFKGQDTGAKRGIDDFLDYCEELGLEGAEITSYFFPPDVSLRDFHAVRRRAHVLGVAITGAAMGNNFTHAPGSPESQRELDEARTWIDRFAEMGAPVIRVFAGRPQPDLSEEVVLKRVQNHLEAVLPHAEKRGVMLGVENHDYVTDVDRLLKLIRGIDSRWLGVIWDSANLSPVPDPYAALERIAPYAVTAQIKVMTRVEGKNVPADYGRLLSILKRAGYPGWVIAEYEEPEDPLIAIPRFVKDLRTELSRA